MRHLRLPAALLTLLLALVLGTGPAAADTSFPGSTIADPSVTGPYGAVRAEFDFSTPAAAGIPDTSGGRGKIAVGAGETRLDARLAGNVHVPENGAGPYPVLVFLHGNHSTCQSRFSELRLAVDAGALFAAYANGTCTTDDAAVDAALEVDAARSYQGYDYLAARLATQGYVVVSLDVNDITDWDSNATRAGYLGRVQLMSKALDLVSRWNVASGPNGIGDLLKGRVDTSRVGVMGCSYVKRCGARRRGSPQACPGRRRGTHHRARRRLPRMLGLPVDRSRSDRSTGGADPAGPVRWLRVTTGHFDQRARS